MLLHHLLRQVLLPILQQPLELRVGLVRLHQARRLREGLRERLEPQLRRIHATLGHRRLHAQRHLREHVLLVVSVSN